MFRRLFLVLPWVAAGAWLPCFAARAQPSCSGLVRASSLEACALAASLQSRAQETAVEAARARHTAAGFVLPGRPTLTVSAGVRPVGEAGAVWSASVGQELELGGQRSARTAAAEAEIQAESAQTVVVRREVLRAAWRSWFLALANRARLSLTQAEVVASEAVATSVRARADRGVAAELDAEVADAAALEAQQNHVQARREDSAARQSLAVLLGLSAESPVEMEGSLTPLALAPDASPVVPERQVLVQQAMALTARAEGVQRSRRQNLTLSVFAQHDRADETAFGLGVAMPVPLLTGLTRNYTAESTDLLAQSRRVSLLADQTLRERTAQWASLRTAWKAGVEALALYPPERLDRARKTLDALNKQVMQGRLGVREALPARQALLGLLRRELEVRLELCLTSADLAAASGAWDGGGR